MHLLTQFCWIRKRRDPATTLDNLPLLSRLLAAVVSNPNFQAHLSAHSRSVDESALQGLGQYTSHNTKAWCMSAITFGYAKSAQSSTRQNCPIHHVSLLSYTHYT